MTHQQRTRQPEQVRARLVEATARLVVDKGIGALTLEAVAREAGVSKGGLLHHFASKRALIQAVYGQLLENLDRAIASHMEHDPHQPGRFSRAYVQAVAILAQDKQVRLMDAATLAISLEPDYCASWTTWLEERVDKSDLTVACRLARSAADGLWLESAMGLTLTPPLEREAMVQRLLHLTLEENI